MSIHRYVYTVWFRDTRMLPDDQDYEWTACFLVEADTPKDALSWGDRLARRLSEREVSDVFLRSQVDDESVASGDLSTLPVVRVGHEASDREIGW